MTFKSDIIALLVPKFGQHLGKRIDDSYSDDRPDELYELADSMLSRLIGKRNAQKQLHEVLAKNKLLKLEKNLR